MEAALAAVMPVSMDGRKSGPPGPPEHFPGRPPAHPYQSVRGGERPRGRLAQESVGQHAAISTIRLQLDHGIIGQNQQRTGRTTGLQSRTTSRKTSRQEKKKEKQVGGIDIYLFIQTHTHCTHARTHTHTHIGV